MRTPTTDDTPRDVGAALDAAVADAVRVNARYDRRRVRLAGGVDHGFPAPDSDLGPGRSVPVARAERYRFTAFGPPPVDTNSKLDFLAEEFDGQPQLLMLHAYCVSHLRKRRFPPRARAIFLRLWSEQGDWLLENLTRRWLISAIITFGDHGTTEAQRRAGLAFSMFFGTFRLYEAERLYSGRAPDEAFDIGTRRRVDLPFGMDPFPIRKADLDNTMLAYLYREAGGDPLTEKLTAVLMGLLAQDPGTIFARLGQMRAQAGARNAGAGGDGDAT